MKTVATLILVLLISGCATRTKTEYYPCGAIKVQEVEEFFTLGTKGSGVYGLFVFYVETE